MENDNKFVLGGRIINWSNVTHIIPRGEGHEVFFVSGASVIISDSDLEIIIEVLENENGG